METPGYLAAILDFVRLHQAWAAPLVFLLAFLESLAFMSLLVPAVGILLALGPLFGATDVNFSLIVIAGGVGGTLGYTLSYWLGFHYKEKILSAGPFASRPEMVARTRSFFDRYGALGVFFGHFFGPVRAVIPVVAGVCNLSRLKFETANVAGAFLFSFGILSPGYYLTASGWLKAVPDFFRALF